METDDIAFRSGLLRNYRAETDHAKLRRSSVRAAPPKFTKARDKQPDNLRIEEAEIAASKGTCVMLIVATDHAGIARPGTQN